jgi:hypothetical protein
MTLSEQEKKPIKNTVLNKKVDIMSTTYLGKLPFT